MVTQPKPPSSQPGTTRVTTCPPVDPASTGHAQSRRQWRTSVQPLTAAGGHKHARISQVKKTDDTQRSVHAKVQVPSPNQARVQVPGQSQTLSQDGAVSANPCAEARQTVPAARSSLTHSEHVKDTTPPHLSKNDTNPTDAEESVLVGVQDATKARLTSSQQTSTTSQEARSPSVTAQRSRSRLSLKMERERKQSLHSQLMSIWGGMERSRMAETHPLIDEVRIR